VQNGRYGATKQYHFGELIAKHLWTELTLEPQGSFWNQYGIDGYLDGRSVQIKADRNIVNREAIYHEYYEKSKDNPNQEWRKSPGIAQSYIFISRKEIELEYIGYLVEVDALARAEVGRKLTLIKPNDGFETSIGIFIPLEDILISETRKCPKRDVKL